MSRSLMLEPSSTAQWLHLVQDAEQEYGLSLHEDLESYLVFMLMRHTQKTSLAQAVMALEYLESQELAGSVRNEKLREIGDQCLILSGLYPKRAARRHVRVSYYVEIGQSAYHHLSNTLQHASAELYRQLCEAFVTLMDILQTIRAFNSPALQPMQTLELWSDTGSKAAFQRLANSSLPLHETLLEKNRKH